MSDPGNSFSDNRENVFRLDKEEDSDKTDDKLVQEMVKWITRPDSPELTLPVRRGMLDHLVVSPIPELNLPELLAAVLPMGAEYVSPIPHYRCYRRYKFA